MVDNKLHAQTHIVAFKVQGLNIQGQGRTHRDHLLSIICTVIFSEFKH